jgi:hypothetical protein
MVFAAYPGKSSPIAARNQVAPPGDHRQTLALTLLVYEFVVRRTIVTRFLFGLRLRPRPDR